MSKAREHHSSTLAEDEISLLEIANTVLRSWRVVAVLPFLLALLVGVWSFTRDRTYAASASFMPQSSEGRGVGGATALAQQFGVSLGTDRPGQSPQFYVDLLRSRTLLRQAVETEYHVPADDGRVFRGTLIQHWELAEQRGSLPPWRRATESLRRSISASVNRETGVVQFTVSSDDPVLSEQIAQSLLNLLNEYNLEVRQRRAQDEGRFISGRMEEAQTELLAAEGALQDFRRQNRQFQNSPELMFEHDRLQRHVAMRQEVYTSLLRSQEQARIDAVRDIPLIVVIDQPAGAAEPEGRGTVLRAVLGFMVGLMLAVFVAFVTEYSRRKREREDPQYREFQDLAREAWADLQRPGRWVRGGAKGVAAGDS